MTRLDKTATLCLTSRREQLESGTGHVVRHADAAVLKAAPMPESRNHPKATAVRFLAVALLKLMTMNDVNKTFDKAQTIDWRVSSGNLTLQRAIDATREESINERLNAAQNEAEREHRVLDGENNSVQNLEVFAVSCVD